MNNQTAISTEIGGANANSNYKDVSTSAEIEQEAKQENNCELSDLVPACDNGISTQQQQAAISIEIGGANANSNYKDVSTSAEIEQEAKQENNCELSDLVPACDNGITTQQQQAAISTSISGSGSGNYEDVDQPAPK